MGDGRSGELQDPPKVPPASDICKTYPITTGIGLPPLLLTPYLRRSRTLQGGSRLLLRVCVEHTHPIAGEMIKNDKNSTANSEKCWVLT